jgi:hypothetical protein
MTGDRLYSLNENEGPQMGLLDEGAVFQVDMPPCAAGLVALHRLLSSTNIHTLSADPAEISMLQSMGWTDETVLGCIATENTSQCGTAPLHRLQYSTLYFFTSGALEYQAVAAQGWMDSGVVGYVW